MITVLGGPFCRTAHIYRILPMTSNADIWILDQKKKEEITDSESLH